MSNISALADTWLVEGLLAVASIAAFGLLALIARRGRFNPTVADWTPYAVLAIVIAMAIAYLIWTMGNIPPEAS